MSRGFVIGVGCGLVALAVFPGEWLRAIALSLGILLIAAVLDTPDD